MQNINFRIHSELQDVNSEYWELRIGRKKVRILEFISLKSDFFFYQNCKKKVQIF